MFTHIQPSLVIGSIKNQEANLMFLKEVHDKIWIGLSE